MVRLQRLILPRKVEPQRATPPQMLKAKQRDIQHQVLNAKEHAREAEIIAQAGTPGAVTIATNMAGRGVDILLGGYPDGVVKEILR